MAKKKSRLTAALLAFIFGGFGAHKFYLNRPGEGLFYVALMFLATNLFGFPLSALLGFFDAFKLLTMDDRVFDEKYSGGRKSSRRQSRSERRNVRRGVQTAPPRRSNKTVGRRSSNNFNKSNPFKKSGINKYKEFDLDGAIEDFNQGIAISEGDIALHWNIACAYSLTEKKNKAYYHLNRAVELGFSDFDKIQTHDDLAYVRIQPEYDDFKAGGYRLSRIKTTVPTSTPVVNQPQQTADHKDDVLLSQLNKLAELRKKGLLSENEFAMEREKLLRR